MPADHRRFQRNRKSYIDAPAESSLPRDSTLEHGEIPVWNAPTAPDLGGEMQQSIRAAMVIAGLLVFAGVGYFFALPWFQHAAEIDAVPELARVEAVLEDGKVVIKGTFPSEAQAQDAVDLAAAAVGAENVVSEYTVDESLSEDSLTMSLEVGDLVLFETGSDELTPGFKPALDISVVMLTQVPDAHLTLVGHTDNVGSADSNLELASKRVNAIVDYMVNAGIDRNRLTPVPKGEAEPIAPNSTPEGRRLNRRVEILFGDVLTVDDGSTTQAVEGE